MNIKLQGLLNAVKHVEGTYGAAVLGQVFSQVEPHIEQRSRSGTAIEWHPAAELIAFLEATERVVGSGDFGVSTEIGAAGARENSRGLATRAAFYLTNADFMLRRVASMWRQFNDEGQMTLLHLDGERAALEVTGIARPHALFCATLTGWCQVIADAVGRKNPHVEHTQCRAQGAARCVWDITWER